MKKTILASAIALILAGSAIAQPVSDRAVIPIGVTLVQILRIHVIDGGNIEFVFDHINDYKVGIANSAFYTSKVVVASSTNWELHMGGDASPMTGTDLPGNTLALNNIGFTVNFTGAYTLAGTNYAMGVPYANSNVTANGLALFTDAMATDGVFLNGAAGNGGSIADNAFSILWQCGTMVPAGTSLMATNSILAQDPKPDRYVCNVELEIENL